MINIPAGQAADEIRRAYSLLIDAERITELRALNAKMPGDYRPGIVSGYFDSADALGAAVSRIQSAAGIYIIANSINPALLSRRCNRLEQIKDREPVTSDKDVTRRRWLWIDADPVRPAGISSTEAEHGQAIERAQAVADYLTRQGWAQPILIDSGNGARLDYRIDLPAEDAGLVQRCLAALSDRYGDDTVKIDTSIFNPARIMRLPGTLNRKGDSTADRPHRMCKIISAPDALELVSVEQLEALAGPAETPAAAKPINGHKNGHNRPHNGQAFDLAGFIGRNFSDARGPESWSHRGGTGQRWTLPLCPFNPDHTGHTAWMAQYASGAIAAGCQHESCRWGWTELREKFEPKLKPRKMSAATRPATENANDELPTVIIGTDERRVADEVIDALTQDAELFHRGGILVRVNRDGGTTGEIVRPTGAPTIATAPQPWIRERITSFTRLMKIVVTKNGDLEQRPAHPPQWTVAAIAARGKWPPLRRLTAISDAPVLRPDGSIHQEAGYDAVTGVLYEPSQTFPAIANKVTQADAAAAARRLLEVVQDFRFETQAHGSAWLAALMSPLARFAYAGPSPLFLIDANVAGAGKGLCAQTIGHIVLGRTIPLAGYAHDPAEFAKRITSIALAGDSIALMDNLSGPFGNEALDRMLTAVRWRERLLSLNQMVDLPLLTVWIATGNNVLIAADTARRTIHIRLDVLDEKPEERRDFQHADLLGWIQQNRPQLLTDALTILAGYCRAGKPNPVRPPYGSFEGWSALVRSAVVWCGLPDPCLTRAALAANADSTADVLSQLLDAWEAYNPHNVGIVISELVARLYPREYPPTGEECVAMRSAIEALTGCPPGKTPSVRMVGTRLRTYRRRVKDGAYLDIDRKTNSGVIWKRFQPKNEGASDYGDFSDSFSAYAGEPPETNEVSGGCCTPVEMSPLSGSRSVTPDAWVKPGGWMSFECRQKSGLFWTR